jgi:hypothetical protein
VKDRVKTPDGHGEVVARSETINGWYIGVRVVDDASLWKGFASDVELIEAAGEVQVLLRGAKGAGAEIERI